MTALRVGRVDFLNTFPLAWGLADQLPEGFMVETLGVPTQLNRLLAAGELDVANVSSIEYATHPGEYVLLPSLCISSRGAVESVNLITTLPLEQVRTISTTGQSAASVGLCRVLFPAAQILPEGAVADARLVIGDAALRLALEDPTPHHDLGELWYHETGLPMVFAVWAARRDTDPAQLEQLDRALAGVVWDAQQQAAQVAEAAARHYDFPVGYIARYLERLQYRFGADERAGLAEYYRRLVERGVLDAAPTLRFVERRPALGRR